jgi:hypothetical protein
MFFPFDNPSKSFYSGWVLWGCGQRGALSKRLWSMRSIVQQVRQTHGTMTAATRPFFFFPIPFKFFVVAGAGGLSGNAERCPHPARGNYR